MKPTYFTLRTSSRILTACGPSSLASESWIGFAEWHVHGLGAIGREMRVLSLGRLHAHLHPLDVVELGDVLFGVDVAETHREQAEHLRALHRVLDHLAERLRHGGVGERVGEVFLIAEDEV